MGAFDNQYGGPGIVSVAKYGGEKIGAVTADRALHDLVYPSQSVALYPGSLNDQGQVVGGTYIGHETGATLGPHDIVGSTFYVAMNMMLAFTLFFGLELDNVPKAWKRSVTCAMLVTGIAFWNYLYMCRAWVLTQQSPTVYRYTDWLITVPIQIVEFYLILQACTRVSTDLFQRLLGTSVLMLAAGYCGETGICGVAPAFVVSMASWLYIVYEIMYGEAGATAANSGSKSGQFAFNTLRVIVSVGWIIYPAGYYVRYLIAPGSPNALAFGYESQSALNVIYNLADLVNKGAFGMAIWAAGKMDQKM